MLVALVSLLCLFPSAPFTYRVTLVDGTSTTAKLSLPDTPEGTVQVDADSTHSLWRPYAVNTPTATVTGKITRWEALPVKGGWKLQRPLGGSLPLDAPLLTFHDMRLFLGKRIAEKKGEPLRFLQLGYANERPGLDEVTLTPAGTEAFVVGGRTIQAKRLRFTAKLWLNGNVLRGTIALGPSGELLRADPPFVSTPLRAGSLLTKTDSGALVMTYRQPAYSLRAEPTDTGYSIKTLVDGHALVGQVNTDSSGKPLRIENDWPGKPFVGIIEQENLSWTLDAPSISRTVLPDPDDLVLFPPQLFATAAWEKGFSAVGEKHPAVLLLLHDGIPEEVEIERLEDPRAGLHRYRFVGENFKADVITDGTRLKLLRSADGSKIIDPSGDASLLSAIPALTWS